MSRRHPEHLPALHVYSHHLSASCHTRRARAEDEQRRQKFALVSQSFGKKEEALLLRVEAAEAAAASSAADAQRLQVEAQQAAAEAAQAQQQLAAAQQAAEAQQTAAAEEQQAAAALRAALAAAEERAAAVEAQAAAAAAEAAAAGADELEAVRQEAARLQEELDAASGQQVFAEQAAEALQAELEQLRQQHQQLQQEAAAAAHSVAAAALQQRTAAGAASGSASPGSGMGSPHAVQEPAGGAAALLAERDQLRAQLADADKQLSAGLAAQQAKVAALEKQNRELGWQVAMLTRGEGPAPARRLGIGGPPGSVSVPMPAGMLEGASERPLAMALGWALSHRRGLLMGYLAFLHGLVYYVATAGQRHASSAGAAGALPGT